MSPFRTVLLGVAAAVAIGIFPPSTAEAGDGPFHYQPKYATFGGFLGASHHTPAAGVPGRAVVSVLAVRWPLPLHRHPWAERFMRRPCKGTTR